MSDFAYFGYATVIPPVGNQPEGTPAHYLIQVMISSTSTGERRTEAELRKIANDFLALTQNREGDTIAGLKKIRKSEAERLKRVRLEVTYHDGAVYLVEEIK